MSDQLEWAMIRQPGESVDGTVYRTTVTLKDRKTGAVRDEARWVAEFKAFDYRGRLKTYRASHPTEARAWRAMPELQARAIEGKQPPRRVERSKVGVAKYLTDWHERRVKTGKIRPTTAVEEKRHVAVISSMEIGSLPLRAVTTEDVDQFLRDLESRYSTHPRTAQKVFQVVRTAFNAAPAGTWKSDPLYRAERPTAPEPEVDSFTPEQLAQILEAVEQPLPGDTLIDEQFSSLIWFLARTGARVGEAQALRWRDVDFRSSTVTIQAGAYEQKGEGIVIGPTKTSRRRDVYLPASVVSRLQAVRSRHSPMPMDIGDRFVFGRESGLKPFRRSNMLRRRWHVLLDSLKIERRGFHVLRHSFATISIAAGSDIKTTSAALGHASAAFTLERYTHALPGRQAEAAAKVDALLEAAAASSEK